MLGYKLLALVSQLIGVTVDSKHLFLILMKHLYVLGKQGGLKVEFILWIITHMKVEDGRIISGKTNRENRDLQRGKQKEQLKLGTKKMSDSI
jgi:hypothetical protein